MNYAATGLPGIFPVLGIFAETEISSVETLMETPVLDDSGNGQNDLITFEWQQYRVKRGDAISVIAQRYGISVGAIIASNEIRNARTLQEGAVLRIPNIDGIPYQIKNGDSLLKIAASFNIPLEVILDVNDIKSDNIVPGETIFIPGARMNDIDLRLSLGELFMYPVQSRYVTSPYGMRKDPISGVVSLHTGIDLRADTGTTVMASLDGVISVIAENWLYGKYIIMTHDNGYKTLYAHLNSYSVNRGDRVARGRKIGESGNTGYSTGPHLHFSIYDKNNKLVNPLELLR
jgi:murein DD-endopeptidase MepM/ murein hydrolase activator NlpD